MGNHSRKQGNCSRFFAGCADCLPYCFAGKIYNGKKQNFQAADYFLFVVRFFDDRFFFHPVLYNAAFFVDGGRPAARVHFVHLFGKQLFFFDRYIR